MGVGSVLGWGGECVRVAVGSVLGLWWKVC